MDLFIAGVVVASVAKGTYVFVASTAGVTFELVASHASLFCDSESWYEKFSYQAAQLKNIFFCETKVKYHRIRKFYLLSCSEYNGDHL